MSMELLVFMLIEEALDERKQLKPG